MIYPVKYFHSAMRGAPTVSGTAGALIGMLDACLLTGFGLVTVTGISVAGGVATATVGAGNSFEEGAVVLMDGDMPAELKGEVRALTSASASFSYATAAADGTYTGSITAKYAPVGQWEKTFSGTNLAVYRSTDVQSNGHYLRVDDTGSISARVRGYESMADANTGTGPFPTDAQMSGGGAWHKSIAANATAVRWKLAGDSRMILLCIAAGSGANAANHGAMVRGFGDPLALMQEGDAWGTVLSANGSSMSSGINGGALDSQAQSGAGGVTVCPRAWHGLGSAVLLNSLPYTGGTTISNASGIDTTLGAFPSELDGQLKLSTRYLAEQGVNKPPRANIPGVLHAPQTGLVGIVADGDTLDGSGDLAGRRLLAVASAPVNSFSVSPLGIYFLDITGPWR